MSRIIVISEDWTDDDMFRHVVAEVNEDDGSRQYSRTPFLFSPTTTYEEADQEIVSGLRGYLSEGDEQIVTR